MGVEESIVVWTDREPTLDEELRDLNRIAPKALEWVALNHEALTRFWFEGQDLMIQDVADFSRSLKRV